jgi:peptide/nickel transport system ATP-binding protein
MLQTIPGTVPNLFGDLAGCHFRNRCRFAHAACAPAPIPLRPFDDGRTVRCVLPDGVPATEAPPPDTAFSRETPSTTPVLEAREIKRSYRVSTGFLRPNRSLTAVNGVSLSLGRGEVVGLVGESGCGKTTLAHMLLGLEPPSGGQVLLDGQDVTSLPRRALARRLQPVFQDPYSSLNSHKTIGAIIGLPLHIHGIADRAVRRQRVAEMMRRVGLDPAAIGRYPAQLSGGQRQRVAIARALIIQPDIVICDEPTSALDVSVQAQILNLLLELGRDFHLAYLLISHNLAVVQHMATRVAVMYLGRIVEAGPTETIFRSPRHPYTRALLASVLTPEPGVPVPDPRLGGSMPNPLDPPSGCRFHPRCPEAMEICRRVAPQSRAVAETPLVECHLYHPTA